MGKPKRQHNSHQKLQSNTPKQTNNVAKQNKPPVFATPSEPELGVLPLRLQIFFRPPVTCSLYDVQVALESTLKCRLFFLELYENNTKGCGFVHYKDEQVIQKFQGQEGNINIDGLPTVVKFVNSICRMTYLPTLRNKLLHNDFVTLGTKLSSKFPCKVVSNFSEQRKYKLGEEVNIQLKIIPLGTAKFFIKDFRKIYCLAEPKFVYNNMGTKQKLEVPPNGAFQFQVSIKVPATYDKSFMHFAFSFQAYYDWDTVEQFIVGFPKIAIEEVKSAEDIKIKIDDGSNVWDTRARKQILVGQISRVNSSHIHSDFGNPIFFSLFRNFFLTEICFLQIVHG